MRSRRHRRWTKRRDAASAAPIATSAPPASWVRAARPVLASSPFCRSVAVSPWGASALEGEGIYKGRGAGSRLEATVRKTDDGSYTLEVSTIGTYVDGIGGRCTGSVSATGNFNAERSRIIAVAVDPDLKTASAKEVCVLVGDFGGARLRIESWGCTTFHGAKCGFDGRLKYASPADARKGGPRPHR